MKKSLFTMMLLMAFIIAGCSNNENATTEVEAENVNGKEEVKSDKDEKEKTVEEDAGDTKNVESVNDKTTDEETSASETDANQQSEGNAGAPKPLSELADRSLYVLPMEDDDNQYSVYVYADNEVPLEEKNVKSPDLIKSKDVVTGDFKIALQLHPESMTLVQGVDIPIFIDGTDDGGKDVLAFERGAGAYILDAGGEQVLVLRQAATNDKAIANGGYVTNFYHIAKERGLNAMERLNVHDAEGQEKHFELTQGNVKELDDSYLQSVSLVTSNTAIPQLWITTYQVNAESSNINIYNRTVYDLGAEGVRSKYEKWLKDESFVFGFPEEFSDMKGKLEEYKSLGQEQDEAGAGQGMAPAEEGNSVPEVKIKPEKYLLEMAENGFLGDIIVKLGTTEKELLSVYPGLEYGFFEVDAQYHKNYRFIVGGNIVSRIEYVFDENTPFTLGEVKAIFGEPDKTYENWQQNSLLHIYYAGDNWLTFKTDGMTWDNDMPLKSVQVELAQDWE